MASAPKTQVESGENKPIVDQSKPITKIKVRLHTGETVMLDLNTEQQVKDIFTYCLNVAPPAKGGSF